jgi:hypothetical protein
LSAREFQYCESALPRRSASRGVVGRPSQRRAAVLEFATELCQQSRGPGTLEFRPSALGEREVVLAVAFAHVINLGALKQPCLREVPNSFQHAHARRLAGARLHAEQVLGGQRLEHFQWRVRDRLRGVEGAAAREHRERQHGTLFAR